MGSTAPDLPRAILPDVDFRRPAIATLTAKSARRRSLPVDSDGRRCDLLRASRHAFNALTAQSHTIREARSLLPCSGRAAGFVAGTRSIARVVANRSRAANGGGVCLPNGAASHLHVCSCSPAESGRVEEGFIRKGRENYTLFGSLCCPKDCLAFLILRKPGGPNCTLWIFKYRPRVDAITRAVCGAPVFNVAVSKFRCMASTLSVCEWADVTAGVE